MKTPRTRTLLILAICFVSISPIFMRGVVVLQPVLTSGGEPVLRADGKPLFREDAFGQLKVNWDAYALLSLGLFCFGWSALRGIQYLYERNKHAP